MINKVVEVRNGLKFTFSVPATPEEYVTAASRGPNSVLDDALDNNIYRTGLPDVWDMLAEALEKQFSIPKLTKPHPVAERAAKGETVVNETNPAYVDRVAATQGVEPVSFQNIVDGFGVVPLDLTERRGKGGGALVGKQDLDMAGTILDAEPAKRDAAIARLTAGGATITLTGERAADQRAVALGIKTFRANATKGILS